MYGGVERAGARDLQAFYPSSSRIVENGRKSVVGQSAILVRSNATADATVLDQLDISWELIMLLSAEFLLYGLVEIPLLSLESDAVAEANFIKENVWLAPTVLTAYVLLTLPIAMGYNWFIQQWPLDLVVMLGIYTSLAAVCHVASVYTNPAGVFVGCISLSLFLFILSIIKTLVNSDNKIFRFSKMYIAIAGILWQVLVFLTLYLIGDVLSPITCLGSGIVAIGVTIFILAELRLIENKICVFFTLQDRRTANNKLTNKGVTRSFTSFVSRIGRDRDHPDSPGPPEKTTSAVARTEKSHEKAKILERDPFTLAIWINCATWRFLVQIILLLQKLIVEFFSIIFLSIIAVWRWIVSLFAQKTPGDWFTPETVRKLFRINKHTKQNANTNPS